MKGILLFLTLVIITWSSCFKYGNEDCAPPDNFDIPDKVIYSTFTLESAFRYVVEDSLKRTFKQISTIPPMAEVQPQFKTFIDNFHIHSIDFLDSFNLEANSYKDGVLYDEINGYTHFNQEIKFTNLIHNAHITLYIVPKNNATIPFFMSFYRKKGQTTQISDIRRDEAYMFYNQESIVSKIIKENALQKGDTIYTNKVNLIYNTY